MPRGQLRVVELVVPRFLKADGEGLHPLVGVQPIAAAVELLQESPPQADALGAQVLETGVPELKTVARPNAAIGVKDIGSAQLVGDGARTGSGEFGPHRIVAAAEKAGVRPPQ